MKSNIGEEKNMYISPMFKRLCIIPARGGSKRIPGKNIRPFLGKPILHYSIAAAKATGLFDTIMVSTDDEKVAEEALKAGAEIPFLRSQGNAGDFATTADVLLEVLKTFAQQNVHFEQICCLYPTAVFAQAHHLMAGWLMLQQGAEVTYPMVAFDYPVWRALKSDSQGFVEMVWPEFAGSRSQDLQPLFHDAGQWYWLNVPSFMTSGQILGGKAKGLEISRLMAQDIDDEEDWALAEMKFAKFKTAHQTSESIMSEERELQFIPVKEHHGADLLSWRNDPETRAQSVQTEPISEAEHWSWFQKKLKDPHCLMRMATTSGQCVGVVRADKDEEGWWWLSWTVAPSFRGKGWGKIMVKNWVNLLQHFPVKALIRVDNQFSERMAIYAGLERIKTEREFLVFSNKVK